VHFQQQEVPAQYQYLSEKRRAFPPSSHTPTFAEYKQIPGVCNTQIIYPLSIFRIQQLP
jgi:hypothetical protein